ncbi:hypothetical protein EI94DRAFT_1741224 [Lactarius quietus]|nr:hypothetical protein EI94DRAFT_1741224 [Lactarius quietus]
MLSFPATKERPKSETYKQAWSISEQHLLERLLAEIPDSEKNQYEIPFFVRKAHIFIRVQKYFEKLKLYGVNVDRA